VAVTRGSTAQTLTATGTVRPAQQATVTFPISGTVATVAVAVGQTVRAGQVLATLDPTALNAALDAARSSLAGARATLAAAQAGQTAAAVGAGSGSSTGSSSRTATGTGTAAKATTGAAKITALQATLVRDQTSADAALAAAATALQKARAACGQQPAPTLPTDARAAQGGSDGSVDGTSDGTPTDPAADPAADPWGAPSAGQQSCLAAESDLLHRQTATQQAQQAVAKDEVALDDALVQAIGSASSGSASSGSASSGSASSSAASSGSASTTGRSTGSTGSGSAPVSAAQLAADQASIDAATAAVDLAEQNRAQATVTSPISGLVHAVGLAVGDRVTAASSSASVVVAGTGDEQVVTQVPVSDLPSIKAGQHAHVTPDGSATPVDGTVATIGLLPASGTTSYPVTVTLPGVTTLPNGSAATVSFEVGASTGSALLVPTSAITVVGRGHTVRVLDQGRLSTAQVRVGAIGPVWTEVTSGLQAGQQVVVAEVDAPLPSGNTGLRGFGGGGGLGGAQRGNG
jgi:HlyD family secretion protein